MDEKVRAYHSQVWRNRESREFLETRGLSHSTVSRFRLGFVGVPVRGERTRVSGHPVQGTLILPYEDGLGRVRQIRYRPLYPCPDKYLTLAGDKAHLFAVRAADNAVCYVAEGELDAMSLWQVGLRAVGIPGANNWRPEWRWLFRNCDKVVLCLDPDDAGIRAAQTIYQGLNLVTDVEVARLPRGLDVNDMLTKHGPQRLREAVAA